MPPILGAILLLSVGLLLVTVVRPSWRRTTLIVTLNLVVVFAVDRAAGRLLGLSGAEPVVWSERFVPLRLNPPNLDHFETASWATDRSPEDRRVRFQTDRWGFIAPSLVHDRPQQTVAFLGGSSTECRLVRPENRFAYRVGRRLEAAGGIQVNSINAGRAGNTSLHSINILLNLLVEFDPDVVVMMHNVNDLTLLIYEGTYWNDHRTRGATRTVTHVLRRRPTATNLAIELSRWLVPHSSAALARRLGPAPKLDEWAERRHEFVEIDTEAIVEPFASNLRLFVEISRSRGIQPVLMTQANRFAANQGDGEDPFLPRAPNLSAEDYMASHIAFNEAVRRVARELEVPLVDIDLAVPRTREMIYDAVHLTDMGSLRAAGQIAAVLRPVLERARAAPASDLRPHEN